MNPNTGQVISPEEANRLSKILQENFVPIDIEDMTNKQKELMHVSPYDNRSKLGIHAKNLRKSRKPDRNGLCACGSYKKYKKCCMPK